MSATSSTGFVGRANPSPERDFPPALSFTSQARQYPATGPAGIGYFKGEIDATTYVDCLLWRDTDGTVRGILNHYPTDLPPWEKAGNINIFIDPTMRRRGIATALLMAASQRWLVNLSQQRYTSEGRAFIMGFQRGLAQ